MTEPYDLIRTFIQANVHAITQELYLGYTGTTTPGDDPTVLNAAVAASIKNRITALEGTGVLTQYTTSATWTNPTPAAHNLITVICINGGNGGGKASALQGLDGGQSGGYVSRQLYTDQITSTVAMTVGAAGAGSTTAGAAGAVGGVTSFGSYVTGVSGVGAIYKDDGSYATSIPPGVGGRGFYATSGASANWPSQRGESGPFAAGGEAGTSGAGAAGQAAPAGIPSGGGGGGGGGNASTGGAGGFPGGGGGAGGLTTGGAALNGGNGAAGCIYVIT